MTMTNKAGQFAAVSAMLMAGTILGCCSCGQTDVKLGEATLPAGEGSAAFLDRTSAEPVVSENDAMRGVLMLLEGQDGEENFSDRVKSLQRRGIAPTSWDFLAARPITKGRLAYMVYNACKLSGGVTVKVFGPSQWYCLRELQNRRFMTNGAVYAPVRGMEFVAVINRADQYLQTGEIPDVLQAGR